MRSRCARSRFRWRCATARSRKASAPKATTWACACWSESARRWSRPTTLKGNGADALAERAVAMARVAPEDKFAGLADASLLAHEFPDLDLIDPALPDVGALEAARARGRRRGARRQRREQIGRRERVGRHRRHGAGDEPRLSRRLSGLAPFDVDGGDRGRRHRHGARLRFLLGAACRRPRSAGEDRHASRASAR